MVLQGGLVELQGVFYLKFRGVVNLGIRAVVDDVIGTKGSLKDYSERNPMTKP
jgi:hypothetical protein